jgi:hypothetical protein
MIVIAGVAPQDAVLVLFVFGVMECLDEFAHAFSAATAA